MLIFLYSTLFIGSACSSLRLSFHDIYLLARRVERFRDDDFSRLVLGLNGTVVKNVSSGFIFGEQLLFVFVIQIKARAALTEKTAQRDFQRILSSAICVRGLKTCVRYSSRA